MSSPLRGSQGPLTDYFDVALLDLDGVVYVGPHAVPGVPQALQAARRAGLHLAFVTNNAARPPTVVANHLAELGVPAAASDVITSAQAAARYLAEQLPVGATVLVLGTTGLHEALAERGLRTADSAGPDVAAVVQGYSPEMNWRLLAEGAVAINAGVPWVATNIDPTVPSPRGPLPGNGSLVAALRLATGKTPTVTGKPDPSMHRETLIRTGAKRPVVVGDRLDTDIEGANAVGCPSLLVFSGVTDAAALLAAGPHHRPTYIGADVSALLTPHPEPATTSDQVRCGRWMVSLSNGGARIAAETETTATTADTSTARDAELESPGDGTPEDGTGGPFDDDTLDALRALCAAWWARTGVDHAHDVSGFGHEPPVRVEGADDAGTAVLVRLGLLPG